MRVLLFSGMKQCKRGKKGVYGSPVHAKFLELCLTLCNPTDCSMQGPLSMGFSRQEYWSGLPSPPPGDLPDPGIEPAFLMSPALADVFLTMSATWEAPLWLSQQCFRKDS